MRASAVTVSAHRAKLEAALWFELAKLGSIPIPTGPLDQKLCCPEKLMQKFVIYGNLVLSHSNSSS